MENKFVGVCLPQELIDRIDEAAKRDETSRSRIIRLALRQTFPRADCAKAPVKRRAAAAEEQA